VEAGQWVPHGDVSISTVAELADSIDAPTLVAGELTSEERQRLMRKKVNIHLAPPSLCVRRPPFWRSWLGRVGSLAGWMKLPPSPRSIFTLSNRFRHEVHHSQDDS